MPIDLRSRTRFGKTQFKIPPLVLGTVPFAEMFRTVKRAATVSAVQHYRKRLGKGGLLDSAGRYGAGKALKRIRFAFQSLNVRSDELHVCNKVSWLRVPKGRDEEPFESCWRNLRHNAVQLMDRDGILKCWDQGLQFLGEEARPKLVALHDVDEFLDGYGEGKPREAAFRNLCRETLPTLKSLKIPIGLGLKNWQWIPKFLEHADLDWVMIANSWSVLHHAVPLQHLFDDLRKRQIGVIIAAPFNGGFLLGQPYFNYHLLPPGDPLFTLRARYNRICQDHQVSPMAVALQFALGHPAVSAVAVGCANAEEVEKNAAALEVALRRGIICDLEEGRVLRQGVWRI